MYLNNRELHGISASIKKNQCFPISLKANDLFYCKKLQVPVKRLHCRVSIQRSLPPRDLHQLREIWSATSGQSHCPVIQH